MKRFIRGSSSSPNLWPRPNPTGVAEAPEIPQALPQAVLDTVTSLAFAIDAKDHYTQGHSQKVSAYAALIAEALGMSDAEVEEIRLGAVLHDIGKVAIPENILNKNGPLNPDEWEIMKSHVTFGAKFSTRSRLSRVSARWFCTITNFSTAPAIPTR